MLSIDVGANPSVALGLGHHVGGQGGLARTLRTEDLDHPSPGNPTDAEGQIQGQRPGRNDLDRHRTLVAHLHDSPLAELLLDLPESDFEGLLAVVSKHLLNRFPGRSTVLAAVSTHRSLRSATL